MKIEKTVQVPQKVTKATTRRVNEYFCDVCTKEIRPNQRRYKCTLCERDIHGFDFTRAEGERQCCAADPRDWGDYPSIYCIICYDLKYTGKYNDIYNELHSNLIKEEEALERKIKRESLKCKSYA